MRVFVAKTLIEDVDITDCSVEVFDTIKKAQEYMESELKWYANNYEEGMSAIDLHTNYGTMEAGDNLVTIKIEEHEIQ